MKLTDMIKLAKKGLKPSDIKDITEKGISTEEIIDLIDSGYKVSDIDDLLQIATNEATEKTDPDTSGTPDNPVDNEGKNTDQSDNNIDTSGEEKDKEIEKLNAVVQSLQNTIANKDLSQSKHNDPEEDFKEALKDLY